MSYAPVKACLYSVSLLLALAACDQRMDSQPKLEVYETFANASGLETMRPPPPDTVPWQSPTDDDAAPEAYSLADLRRGRERYDIYCTPCHGVSGQGDGPVVQHGFPAPASFHLPVLRGRSTDYFVEVISNGTGVMFSHADRIPLADRYSIARYIRALQLSRQVNVADFPAIIAALEEGTP